MSNLSVWEILKSPVVTEKSVILKEDSTEENSDLLFKQQPDQYLLTHDCASVSVLLTMCIRGSKPLLSQKC